MSSTQFQLLEDKVVAQGKPKGKCIWVGRKRDFFSFHSSLIPIERSKVGWGDFEYCDFMRIRARNIFFQYKKREHERRHRYKAEGTRSSLLQKQFEDMHRCEVCQGIFETVDLFWGITLCRKCYFTPEYINFIMSNRFGDLITSANVSKVPLSNHLNSALLPEDRLQTIREMKPGFKPNEYVINELCGESLYDPKQLDALKVRRKNCFSLLDQDKTQGEGESSGVMVSRLPMQMERTTKKRKRVNLTKSGGEETVELKLSPIREKDRVQTSLISYFVKPSSPIEEQQLPETTIESPQLENTSPTVFECGPEENGMFYGALYVENPPPHQDSQSPTQDNVEELVEGWDFSDLQFSGQTPSNNVWYEDLILEDEELINNN
jgi:hypothetical protein